MIISEQWLREWVTTDLDAQAIADCLTAAGLEVDGVESVGVALDNVVVGRVVSIDKHPDADRLQLTQVDIGDEQLSIVCGASNVAIDMLTPVATVGAKLPNGLKIKKAKVRGVESFGMLCSAAELGLAEQSDGLLDLDDDATPGQRIDEYLQLNDHLIDIDLTPNRGDCLSVQGVARELKVLADADYHPLSIAAASITAAAEGTASIDVQVADSAACPVYIGRVITGVNASAATPLWMREKLRRCGLNSISIIVDITNYVMLELGQPMHAFDRDKLSKEIIVRQSVQGEKLHLLDESEIELDDDSLVIADAKAPLALAGVMGGLDSAINASTQNIVLEAAHFTRSAIAGRARRYGLHTDSSHRFERGVDPQLPAQAIERATALIIQYCGGEAASSSVVDNRDGKTPDVKLSQKRLSAVLGMPLGEEEVTAILGRIADQVVFENGFWSVTPPSYRFDIERECDLIEEVARVKGYDNIPTTMPRVMPTATAASESQVDIKKFRQTMVARDYREAINYSFISEEDFAQFSDATPLRLSNPLAENMAVMRDSLLPGLMKALQFNKNRQHERVRLFEIGAVYQSNNGRIEERQKLAAVVSGLRLPTQWSTNNGQMIDFYDIKADLEALVGLTTSSKLIIFDQLEHVAMHPGQASCIKRGGLELGWLGKVHPVLQKQYDIIDDVFVFEIDLDLATASDVPVFTGVSRFPSVKRDLSVLVAHELSIAQIKECITTELGDALSNLVLFDVYTGKGIAEHEKSVSFSLTLQHQSKTMTDEDAEKRVGKVLTALSSKFGARLRSS